MMIGSRVACVLAIALVFAFSARAAEKDRDDSLVLHYTFDKDTGQTAKDQSGTQTNARDGLQFALADGTTHANSGLGYGNKILLE